MTPEGVDMLHADMKVSEALFLALIDTHPDCVALQAAFEEWCGVFETFFLNNPDASENLLTEFRSRRDDYIKRMKEP